MGINTHVRWFWAAAVWNKTSRSLLLVSGLLAFLSRKCFLRCSLADITCSMLLQMVLHLTMCSQLVGWIPHITLYPHLQYLCTNVIPWFLKILWEFYTLYVFIISTPPPTPSGSSPTSLPIWFPSHAWYCLIQDFLTCPFEIFHLCQLLGLII